MGMCVIAMVGAAACQCSHPALTRPRHHHRRLSEDALYHPYVQVVKLARRTAHDALIRECFIDYDRERALVPERQRDAFGGARDSGGPELTKMPRNNHGEVAMLVADAYQGHGIGAEQVRRLVRVARDERVDRVIGSTLADHRGMCAVFSPLGFTLSTDRDEVQAKHDLQLS